VHLFIVAATADTRQSARRAWTSICARLNSTLM